MVGRFAVLGLGRFGRQVALELTRFDQPVLAIDKDPERVQEMAGQLDDAVCADATDETALAELRLKETACAVVAIGSHSTEASILATALLRQVGVPRVVARAVSELHGRVLQAVGAHEVVNPEQSIGCRLARHLAHPGVLEYLELAADTELAEVELPASWVGRTLVELDVRRRHGVSVVAIRRDGKALPSPPVDEPMREGDVILVIGEPQAVSRLGTLA